MKKLIKLIPMTLLLLGCSDKPSEDIAKEVNYYFSNKETACAFIFYEVAGASPLKIEEHVIDYHFDENNIIKTSSSYDFGWKSKETGGFRGTHYYKQDGSKIDDIFNFGNGSFIHNETEYDYASFYLSGEPCFSKDGDEENKQFENLIKKIYKKE